MSMTPTTEEAKTAEPDVGEIGRVVWHSSDEDSGPDVGVTIGFGQGRSLWFGEISRKMHEEEGAEAAELGDHFGTWIILYDDNKPRGEQATVIGKAIPYVATDVCDAISASLRGVSAAPRADSAERTAGAPSFATAWDPATAIASGVMRLGWAISGADSCNAVCGRHAEVQEVAESVLSLRATPAPSSPGVPDSVREAIRELVSAVYTITIAPLGTEVARLYRAVAPVAEFISAHPAGQSATDEHDHCEICGEPLLPGQRVIEDVNCGTVHYEHAGPERDSFVKNVETGEPLGPNDPIPQGYVYEPERPAGQSTGQGAEIEAAQITLGEGLVDITRIDHEGRTGVLFRPRKERIPFGEPGELPEGAYWPVKGDVVLWVSGEGPGVAIKALADLAPDSTRTGQVETDALADLDKHIGWATAGPLTVTHSKLVEWREVFAARPAAPGAQGAERVRHVKRGTEYDVLHRGVSLQVALDRLLPNGREWTKALIEGDRLVIYQGADGKVWAREESEFDDGRFEPAPPASSGQESAR